jgi:hypothetical protein
MNSQQKRQQIEWCRQQQAAAHEHMAPGHSCDHPQCCPSNNLQWLLDTFGEELVITYGIEA